MTFQKYRCESKALAGAAAGGAERVGERVDTPSRYNVSGCVLMTLPPALDQFHQTRAGAAIGAAIAP